MVFDPAAACPADVRARAAAVRLACFDVDGTLTDGRIVLDSEGRETKCFHVRDGQGLALLRRAGIGVHERQVSRFVRRDREGHADETGLHRIDAGGFGIQAN